MVGSDRTCKSTWNTPYAKTVSYSHCCKSFVIRGGFHAGEIILGSDRKIHKSCGAEILNIGSPQVSKAEMMDSFPAANIYLGKTSGRFSKRKYFCQKQEDISFLSQLKLGPNFMTLLTSLIKQ